MSRARRSLVLVLIGCVVLLPATIIGLRILLGYALVFGNNFETVEIGMDESRVIDLLGRPDRTTTDFHLGQYEGYEKQYALAASSNSDHYLIWYRGIDHVYAVGVDNNGKVTMKAAGGT